jgi:hypothetical protein
LAAVFGCHQEIQRLRDDVPLKLLVEGHTKVMAHHERHKQRTRWLDPLGDIQRNRDRDRRDTALFDSALNQRD